MTGPKLNERPGTRAVLRHFGTSAFKVRPVLDLIRDHGVAEARDILRFCERDAATAVGKLLASAVANAENNDGMDPEELFVSACYADEGTTAKRWRPRARGRATRIRKRSCHITVIVSRLSDEKLARARAAQAADTRTRRTQRVAAGRGGRAARRDEQAPGTAPVPPTVVEEGPVVDEAEETQMGQTETETTRPGMGQGPHAPEEGGVGAPPGAAEPQTETEQEGK